MSLTTREFAGRHIVVVVVVVAAAAAARKFPFGFGDLKARQLVDFQCHELPDFHGKREFFC
jgi:hypothetical protein